MKLLGWVGSLLLATCGFPAAIQSIREKSSKGMNWYFLGMWTIGEVFTLLYVMPKSSVLPLIVNYILNLLFLSVIIYYKVKDEFKKVV